MLRDGLPSQIEINLFTASQENPPELLKNINAPNAPKKCIGFRENRVMNPMVIKSKNPLMNRSRPNFEEPYFLAWC